MSWQVPHYFRQIWAEIKDFHSNTWNYERNVKWFYQGKTKQGSFFRHFSPTQGFKDSPFCSSCSLFPCWPSKANDKHFKLTQKTRAILNIITPLIQGVKSIKRGKRHLSKVLFPKRSARMIVGSEKRKRQLASELQSSRPFEKSSKLELER